MWLYRLADAVQIDTRQTGVIGELATRPQKTIVTDLCQSGQAVGELNFQVEANLVVGPLPCVAVCTGTDQFVVE